jgi:CRISPR-associated endoribonuclease Cas6
MKNEPIINRQSSIVNSPDLYALIIRLIANQNGRLSATQGHLAHAAFLNTLQQVDPVLSETIHEINGRKPFTISGLHGFGKSQKGQQFIRAGQEGWLRVTLLDTTLFHTFIQYFLSGNQQSTIRLENIEFTVTEILTHPNSHPQSGFTSLEHLHHHWASVTPKAEHQTIQLAFHTPTAFSIRNPQTKHRHFHILPDPVVIFGELAASWDRLTGDNTKDAIRQFALEYIVVMQHKIESHMFQYRKSKQVGFTGVVTFKIMTDEYPELTQHINRLADLTFYTGIGSKTAQGMGHVSRGKK